ncbi:MAG: crotonyl-CoA carboxylase/reductase [Hungatella sp.]|jgi:crotonyl-CoA carboxylase/reductase|nr:crotonyl-CoA carboxylase/reductase [Hungatella sp.]
MGKRIYEIGEIPPLGYVPDQMYAWTIRKDRFGEPIQALKLEVIDIPYPKDDEIIVLNKFSGINYNGVWASLGKPKNVLQDQKEDFFICGSESSGIIYAVGEKVDKFHVGDEVICVGIQFDEQCKLYQSSRDPRVSPTFKIWGYESNWGAFAQFSLVKQCQCMKKPKEISWTDAAGYLATGGTIYSMLHWEGNEIKPGDVVLIWGGAGGLGSNAIPIVRAFGGIPVAVVSNDERGEYCLKLGAAGYINRSEYNHWGPVNDELFNDKKRYGNWVKNITRFRKAIWHAVGEKKDPQIVLEHPGGDTLPTSMLVCGQKGIVVLCGATSGYLATLDLRYLWLHLKRLQGSHATTMDEVEKFTDLIVNNKIKLQPPKIFPFTEVAAIHQNMYNNMIEGNCVVQIS